MIVFLILPQGRLNIHEFPFYRDVAQRGQPEADIWRFSWGGRERFNPVWDMVLEMSTGYSGAFARQVTLTKESLADESDVRAAGCSSNKHREKVLSCFRVMVSAVDGDSSSAIHYQFWRRWSIPRAIR